MVSSALFLQGTPVPGLLITGFEPFDGRSVNGSWVAACSIPFQSTENLPHVQKLLLPVVWGEPIKHLESAIAQFQPEFILSLGEGHIGQITIETVAQNLRKERPDNLGVINHDPISPAGPETRHSSLDAEALQTELAKHSITVSLSTDAGQFLCEETLYSLELLQEKHACVRRVAFVHVPPYGTFLNYQGAIQRCGEVMLGNFAKHLVKAFINL